MCMIAHRPLGRKGRGAHIPNEVITTALNRHPDGFGVAWRENGKLLWERFGPSERLVFQEKLKSIDANRRIEYVAHFRMATHGPAVRELAHPFAYRDPKEGTVLLFHNGVINIATKPSESDTQVFARDVLQRLPSRWWANPALRYLVDEAIGYSKLVIMTARETVNLHHTRGDEDGGLWYSSNHKATYTWSSSGKGGTTSYQNLTDKDWKRLPNGAWVMGDNWDDDESWVNYRDAGIRAAQESCLTGASGANYGVSTGTTTPRYNDGLWLSENHILKPLQDFDFTIDGTYEGAIICTVCQTAGDVYLVDKKAYVDISHVVFMEQDKDLLPEEQEDLLLLPETTATGRATSGKGGKNV